MENKHTPGPWRTGRNTVARNTIVYNKDGNAICDCKIFHGVHGASEMEANAALIAAAPELLERLEELLEYCADLKGSDLYARAARAVSSAKATDGK